MNIEMCPPNEKCLLVAVLKLQTTKLVSSVESTCLT